MFERFDDDGRRVVTWAQEEIRLFRHRTLGSEHLLLGTLHIADPPLQAVFTGFGLDLEVVRDRVLEMTGRGRKGASGHIPFSAAASRVLERSLQLANRLGHQHIGPAHLLLALVDIGDCTAVRVLLDLKVNTNDLALAARAVASGSGDESGAAR